MADLHFPQSTFDPDAATDEEREAIKLARSIADDRMRDAVLTATECDLANPRTLRTLGARAFVLARRLESQRP